MDAKPDQTRTTIEVMCDDIYAAEGDEEYMEAVNALMRGARAVEQELLARAEGAPLDLLREARQCICDGSIAFCAAHPAAHNRCQHCPLVRKIDAALSPPLRSGCPNYQPSTRDDFCVRCGETRAGHSQLPQSRPE